MPALKIKKERTAFFVTVILAVLFVAIGARQGSDLVYGLSTSNTCTTTVTATVLANIWVTCNNVDVGNITPGTPANGTGDVTVNSNIAGGWRLYNYAANYMTRTAAPAQSIANTPSGTPASPEQWNTAADVNKDFGLGFSLSGPQIAAFNSPAVWHNGSGTYSYASITTTAAASQMVNNYYTHSNSAENVTVLYAVDVSSFQLTGTYTAVVSWFAISWT